VSELRNIAVMRALGGIGDVLTAVPALAANPQARITYIGLPQVEKLVRRYPRLVDRFLPFPGFPGIPEFPFEARRLYAFLDNQKGEAPYDLVIQMHGSGSVSNVFAALLAGRRTVGYHVPGLWCPGPVDYAPFPDSLSETARWTTLMARSGFPAAPVPPFPVDDLHRWTLSELVPIVEQAPYAVVHPGASDPRRRWEPEKFARVADRLAEAGLQVILTGTRDECRVVQRVADAMTADAVNICALTTLSEAGALIESAELVVTNDTGTSHIAAALGTPSVVIFIASDPVRWAPQGAQHIAVGSGVPDIPAGQMRAPEPASSPPVEAVLAAVESQLAVFA
jgi:ADP-heptose:LPS heptosyltransferase